MIFLYSLFMIIFISLHSSSFLLLFSRYPFAFIPILFTDPFYSPFLHYSILFYSPFHATLFYSPFLATLFYFPFSHYSLSLSLHSCPSPPQPCPSQMQTRKYSNTKKCFDTEVQVQSTQKKNRQSVPYKIHMSSFSAPLTMSIKNQKPWQDY